MRNDVNIGVLVCECGGKIAGALDVPALVAHARELPSVTWAGQANFWCLPGSLERMQAVITEQHLARVVIAGCAPRTHAPLFRRALDGRVNPMLLHIVNVRDLCVRPHRDDVPAVMAKACDQVAMAVADLAERQPITPRVAHITPHAVVIGGGIAGMTAALEISDADISVTLIEREPELGGLARLPPGDHELAALIARRIAALGARENVRVLTHTTLLGVSGTVGQYRVALSSGEVIEAGTIIVATGGQSNPSAPLRTGPQPFGSAQDKAQGEPSIPHSHHYAFILCDISPDRAQTCARTCCLTAIRRAAEVKRQTPASQATIFFRELYTAGGTYNTLVWEAQQLGVNFVRYPAGRMPQSASGEIVTCDELTGREVRVSCDQVIAARPMAPQEDAAHLAAMFRLPIDSNGFMADPRVRLRLSDRIERGIYVCGAAHYPCDAPRAISQAYSTAARAVRHIQRGEIVTWAPAATIDAARCNGCGDCVRVCPFAAVVLTGRAGDAESGRVGEREVGGRGEGETRRQGEGETRRQGDCGKIAVVDALLCTGCGNCVSVCPVKAAQVSTATDEQIEAQIRAALSGGQGDKEARGQGENRPLTPSPCLPVLLFACEWSGYSAAEIAGARGLAYPANTRLIRVNCAGRLQPGLLLKALEMGAAGVMVLGCAPGVCHYEQGNEHAASVFEQANALGNLMGMDRRLALKWIAADDGAEFVRAVSDFVEEVERKA